MKNDIGELGIEFAFRKILVYFLQVGEQGVFLQFKINIAFGKPGFG
jgi:hypothetical protein